MNRDKAKFFVFGVTVGLALGWAFFGIANRATSIPGTPATAAVEKPKAAPPLSPEDAGSLPANHPPLDPTEGASGGSAETKATSPGIDESIRRANADLGNFTLQLKAAALCYQAGRLDDAITFLTRAHSLQPESFDPVSALGITYAEKGKFAEAKTWLVKAMKLNPNDVETRMELALVYLKTREFGAAETEATHVLQGSPNHERALEVAFRSQIELNKPEAARKSLDRLSSVNPGNPNLLEFRNLLVTTQKTGKGK